MDIPLWFQVSTLTIMTVILIGDLLLILKRPHVPSTKESTVWVSFYIGLALLFAVVLFLMGDSEHAIEFTAGWLTEKSLSIDNLFVFVLIMTQFSVPRKYQQEVLMVGIIIALILRAIFIALGAVLIENLSWIFYIFGAFLVYTAARQLFDTKHEDDRKQESFIVRLLGRFIPIHNEYDGNKLRTKVNGRTMLTPMLIVFITIGITDLVFAVDSIPAIYGITQEPFLVFAANLFALMGLRQLYFLLGDLLDKLRFLKYGVAFILAFIGAKLFFHALHVNELPFINGGEHVEWAPEVSNWTSLGVIFGAIAISTIASIVVNAAEKKKALSRESTQK
ncbi:TerC/Alx family metal homeostasis membrane protein [Microbacterium amylolyticum]|uniref:Tellurite resistance protein TerC n=1 Tax=Microbacterium amylolyticum TaxID=936337 RepID=A0ABS4ZFP9_9MICO|nr:TerC/Alx family metal homeostasis membrane protein [Microbacterium amylolyticum]MBP2435858.1 tellurite resistance protein TerC [Microbacterium amylolyticum]